MKITKAMGKAAKRELESGVTEPVVTIALSAMQNGYEYWSRDKEIAIKECDTALCMIMAIAGVKP